MYVTVELAMKFEPFKVSVCGPAVPTAKVVGDTELNIGTGFVTVVTTKFTAFEGPPPGPGFVTTTGKLPPVAKSPEVRGIVNCVALLKVTA